MNPPSALDILNALHANIAVIDHEGAILLVNEAWQRFSADQKGGAAPLRPGGSYLQLCNLARLDENEATVRAVQEGVEAVLSGRKDVFFLEYPCHTPNEERWFTLRVSPFDAGGERGAVLFLESITERKTAEIELLQSEEKWRRLFAILPVGVSLIDEADNILEMNAALGSILQLSEKELQQGAYRERRYLSEAGQEIVPAEFPSARAVRTNTIIEDEEICVVKQDGTRIWTRVSAAPLPFEKEKAVVVTADMTRLKMDEENLARTVRELETVNQQLKEAFLTEQTLSRTDGLTGLHNRRHFFDTAGLLVAVSRRYNLPLSLIMFDVDQLKAVNDQLGHAAGDEVLKMIAVSTKTLLREADLLARYGGDEFVILLPSTRLKDAAVAAERIRKKVHDASTAAAGEPGVAISLSLGVTMLLSDEDTLDQMLIRADRAMYAAKAAGRNGVAVDAPD